MTCAALSNNPGSSSSRYRVKINASPLMPGKGSSPAAIYLGISLPMPGLAKGTQEVHAMVCGVMAQA